MDVLWHCEAGSLPLSHLGSLWESLSILNTSWSSLMLLESLYLGNWLFLSVVRKIVFKLCLVIITVLSWENSSLVENLKIQ